MKTTVHKEGSALLATLLFVGLMLSLLLYYTALVRFQGDAGAQERAIFLSREALESGIAFASAEIASSYEDGGSNRIYRLPPQSVDWVSSGSGETASGLVASNTADVLGWPEGDGEGTLFSRAAAAEWVVEGDTNEVHTAYAWVAMDLTGLIEPGVMDYAARAELGAGAMDTRLAVSAAEFQTRYPAAERLYVPGQKSLARQWWDTSEQRWRTDAVADGVVIDNSTGGFYNGTDAERRALLAELFPARDTDMLLEAYNDFLAYPEVPSNPDGLTTVAVPMVNEVMASLVVSNLGDRVRIAHELDVEVWYPFPYNTQTNQYRMPRTPALIARTPESVPLELGARASDSDWEFTCPGGEVDAAFARLTMLVQGDAGVTAGDAVSVNWDLGGLELERLDGSGVVDRMPAGLELLMPEVTVPPSGGVVRVERSLEVTDPRINHQLTAWVEQSAGTPSDINAAAIAAQDADGNGTWDVNDQTDSFVCLALTDSLRDTIGPSRLIGYFPLGDAWRSFDLFGREGRWWLRHVYVSGEYATFDNLMNPNTPYPRALATVFVDRELAELPGETGNPLSFDDALLLAGDMNAAVMLGQGFTNGGDWNWAVEQRLVGLAGSRGRHAAEAVLMETAADLSCRSRQWGLVVMAQTRGPGGRVLATRREAVRVWSEPLHSPGQWPREAVMFRRGGDSLP